MNTERYIVCNGNVTVDVRPLERIDHPIDGPQSFKLVVKDRKKVIHVLEVEADNIAVNVHNSVMMECKLT